MRTPIEIDTERAKQGEHAADAAEHEKDSRIHRPARTAASRISISYAGCTGVSGNRDVQSDRHDKYSAEAHGDAINWPLHVMMPLDFFKNQIP